MVFTIKNSKEQSSMRGNSVVKVKAYGETVGYMLTYSKESKGGNTYDIFEFIAKDNRYKFIEWSENDREIKDLKLYGHEIRKHSSFCLGKYGGQYYELVLVDIKNFSLVDFHLVQTSLLQVRNMFHKLHRMWNGEKTTIVFDDKRFLSLDNELVVTRQKREYTEVTIEKCEEGDDKVPPYLQGETFYLEGEWSAEKAYYSNKEKRMSREETYPRIPQE